MNENEKEDDTKVKIYLPPRLQACSTSQGAKESEPVSTLSIWARGREVGNVAAIVVRACCKARSGGLMRLGGWVSRRSRRGQMRLGRTHHRLGQGPLLLEGDFLSCERRPPPSIWYRGASILILGHSYARVLNFSGAREGRGDTASWNMFWSSSVTQVLRTAALEVFGAGCGVCASCPTVSCIPLVASFKFIHVVIVSVDGGI